jgi:hypothetical protein
MTTLQQRKLALFLILSAIIITCDMLMMNSSQFQDHMHLLTVGISLDFVIVIPLLHYLFNFKHSRNRITSLALPALIGYAVLLLIIPSSTQAHLQFIKYVLIPLELCVLGYGGYKVLSIFRHLRRNVYQQHHVVAALRASITSSFGNNRWVSFLAHDLSIFYYIFFAWRTNQSAVPNAASFSYVKQSNWLIIILFISKLLILEGVLLHFVIAQWSHLAAWILSIGNLYVIIMLIADYRAMVQNPITVTKQAISIQYGLQISCQLDVSNIADVSLIKYEKLSKDQLKTAVMPLSIEPNVCITLMNPVQAVLLFGKQKLVDHIYLFLDNPDEFVTACRQAMANER